MQTHIPVDTVRKDISKLKEDLKQEMMVCIVASMPWDPSFEHSCRIDLHSQWIISEANDVSA